MELFSHKRSKPQKVPDGLIAKSSTKVYHQEAERASILRDIRRFHVVTGGTPGIVAAVKTVKRV